MPVDAPRSSPFAAALADIKLAHTVFAMPFAVLGAALALEPDPPPVLTAARLALIVLCMVFARTWAMLINRLADARFDAQNRRTASRAFASGRVSIAAGRRYAAASGALFCAAAALFWPLAGNPWPAALCIPVLAFVALYSFTKRFTALCHAFLGAALAISPLAAALAIRPEALADSSALWLLAGYILMWVAGFDVIYALQDLDFDRAAGLRSIPEALGWRGAAWVSRVLHLVAAAALVAAARFEPRFGPVFAGGVAAVLVLLFAEHAILARRGAEGIPMAFFTLNGVASVTLGVAGLADLAL